MSEVTAIRKSLGMNQTEFAAFIGTNQSTVSRWESGVASPTDIVLAGIRAKAAERQAPKPTADEAA